ncbi:MAG: DUF3422 family protein [Roseiarcus sp.]
MTNPAIEPPAAARQEPPPDETAGKAAPAFAAHPLRGFVLEEIHSRPFHPLETPAQLAHFAFTTDPAQSSADRRAFAAFCADRGVAAPGAAARHHYAALKDGALRWEQHSEFTTYTFIVEGAAASSFESARALAMTTMTSLPPPGPLLVSAALSLEREAQAPAIEENLDESSLVVSAMGRRAALVATDFRLASDGFVHILVRDRALTRNRAGALTQRLLEIETYRTLALLGLPEAQRSAPRVKAVEDALAGILNAMNAAEGALADHKLLDAMTRLAAELEADLAASSFRFGASRAYDSLVQQRLAAIGEEPVGAFSTFASFLSRRLAPAMRTCQTMAARQADLSEKLGRAANLLRTRVDVEIERQNRDLLHSMNERTRLQLRLQQTVEGLSVAAISYYIVGLLGYAFKGLQDLRIGPDPSLAAGAAAPLVVLAVALITWRIRSAHGEH